MMTAEQKTNYEVFRGKCKEACEALQQVMPELRLVRGYYTDHIWDKREPHWWLETPGGDIVDPTKWQFPAGGIAEFYEEFDGMLNCEECGKEVGEETAVIHGNYACCSNICCMRMVGLA